MEAYDNGSPSRRDTALVLVTVDRNLNRPRFEQSSQEVDILYDQELGSTIATVRATDDDSQVGSLLDDRGCSCHR